MSKAQSFAAMKRERDGYSKEVLELQTELARVRRELDVQSQFAAQRHADASQLADRMIPVLQERTMSSELQLTTKEEREVWKDSLDRILYVRCWPLLPWETFMQRLIADVDRLSDYLKRAVEGDLNELEELEIRGILAVIARPEVEPECRREEGGGHMKLKPERIAELRAAVANGTFHATVKTHELIDALDDLEELRQEVEQAYHEGWVRCLDSVIGSLRGYPDLGCDIEIMQEIDRIIRFKLASQLARLQSAELVVAAAKMWEIELRDGWLSTGEHRLMDAVRALRGSE